MRIVSDEAQAIKSIFEAAANIVDELSIKVNDESFKFDSLDSSHITFVHSELKPEYFTEYKCDEPAELNVDTEEVMKVLKRAKSDDTLILEYDEGNLIITMERLDVKRIFRVRLIDIEYEQPSPPDLEYPSTFLVPFDLFKNGIQDVEVIGDKVAFIVDEDKFYMEAEGEFGDCKFEFLHGEAVDGKYRSIYSLEKIKQMLKADKLAPEVKIRLGNGMPLDLSLETLNDEAVLNFVLAPRVEVEEE